MPHRASRLLAACIATIGLCGAAGAPAAAGGAGFVEAHGAQFALDGRPWRPIGYNQYRLTSQPGGYVCDSGYGAISDASLGQRLDEMRDAGANTVRTWFFQSYYDGGGWAPAPAIPSPVTPPPSGAPGVVASTVPRIGRGTAGRVRSGSDGTVRLRRPRVDCRGAGLACAVTTVVRAVLGGARTSIVARAVMPISAGLVGGLHVDLGAAARRRVATRALAGTLRIVVTRGAVHRAKTVRITILPPRRPFRAQRPS